MKNSLRSGVTTTRCLSKMSSETWPSDSRKDPNFTWYRVEAENFESIHNHSAYACVEKE